MAMENTLSIGDGKTSIYRFSSLPCLIARGYQFCLWSLFIFSTSWTLGLTGNLPLHYRIMVDSPWLGLEFDVPTLDHRLPLSVSTIISFNITYPICSTYMVYLPTLGWVLGQMLVSIYQHDGAEKGITNATLLLKGNVRNSIEVWGNRTIAKLVTVVFIAYYSTIYCS